MFNAEYFRKWLQKFPKEPGERLAMAIAAVDASDAFERSLDAADLRPLVIAASSPHKLVFETGCHLLARLAAFHGEAQQCLLRMATDKKATARFHAVAYLESNLPEEMRRKVVQGALTDRSAKVRIKGVERAEEFKFTEFLPLMDEMLRNDPDETVQRSLALHIPILRNGFHLVPSTDGAGYYLTVRGPNGFGGPFIPKVQYSEAFVRREVERLKAGGS